MPTQRFAVEFDRRTVGIAVRVPGGFMFYSSDRRFAGLDGRLFRRARAIERQLERVADRQARARTPGREGHWAAAAMPVGAGAMTTMDNHREEARAIRSTRARAAELLADYPQLSDAGRREILDYLQTARHLDIGLLSSNDQVAPKLDAFMADHRSELGVSPRDAFRSVALIVGFLFACWLLWTLFDPMS